MGLVEISDPPNIRAALVRSVFVSIGLSGRAKTTKPDGTERAC